MATQNSVGVEENKLRGYRLSGSGLDGKLRDNPC
jgi:hypothetical protein